jgi:outer membrane protein OmpA-like peptidoglycan-associated protein
VGVGLEFAAGRHLRLGPVLRFHHLMAASSDAPEDALAAVVGLSVSLQRGAPPPPPPIVEFQGAEWAALAAGPRPTAQVSDRDGDGVYDHRDLCPDEAEGDHPDRARLGCPAGDRDGDGVLDPDDTCPDQAAGAAADPERAGCPDGDDDGDGVVNQVDQCRAEAAGRAPDPQRAGCPAPDADGDMVPDSVDACPREAGAPATRARDHGCPGMVTVSEGQLRTRRPVLFAGEGDDLAPRSERVLEAVAEVLRLAPQVRRVRVEGHVDETDDAMALSERRASRVVTWLTAHGVDASRLESRGLGATRPVRPNTSRRNREHNRRVEFYLVDDAPAAPAAAPAPSSPPPATPAAAPVTPSEPAPLAAPAEASAPVAAPEAGEESAPEGRHGRHGRHHRRSRRHRH